MNPHLIVKISGLPKNKIFITMPFSPEFKKLKEAIKQVIRHIDYEPIHIGDSPQSFSFVQDFREGIQSSKLVVVVCSPDFR
jgi:hypothetical protein